MEMVGIEFNFKCFIKIVIVKIVYFAFGISLGFFRY